MEKELRWYSAVAALFFVFILFIFIFTPVKRLLMPLVLGGVIAYFLRAPVSVLTPKTGRIWAVVIVFLALIIIVGVVFAFVIPIIIRQIVDLADKLPEYAQAAYNMIINFFKSIGIKADNSLNKDIYNQLESFSVQLGKVANKIITNISNITSTLLLYTLSPILAFFILKDSKRLSISLIYFLPFVWRKPVINIIKEIDTQLWRYITSQMLTAFFVGILVSLGLWIAGVRYAPVLGLIAGVFDIIPYIGPLLSFIPIAAVASVQGWSELLWGLIVLVIVQQIENIVLSPLILGGSLKLHPAIIFVTILAGNILYGVVGMIFAVPAVIIARVIIHNIYLSMINSSKLKV